MSGLQLSRYAVKTFPGQAEARTPTSKDISEMEAYTAGMFAANGMPYGTQDSRVVEWLSGKGASAFIEMGEAVLEEIPREELAKVDLFILCHYTPDFQLGTSVTNYLMHRFGMKAMAFALSDQGTGSPLLALKFAGDYAQSNGCKSALILSLDQKVLLYKPQWPDGVAIPENSASAILLTPGSAGYHVRDYWQGEVSDVPFPSSETAAIFNFEPKPATEFRSFRKTDLRHLCSSLIFGLREQVLSDGVSRFILLADRSGTHPIRFLLLERGKG